MKRCLLIVILILSVLLGFTRAECMWMDEEYNVDVRCHAIVRRHVKVDSFIINKIWVDEDMIIWFIDFNRDGVPDDALMHQIWFTSEAGDPYIICHDLIGVESANKYIEKKRRNSKC